MDYNSTIEKEWITDIWDNMDETPKHVMLRERSLTGEYTRYDSTSFI